MEDRGLEAFCLHHTTTTATAPINDTTGHWRPDLRGTVVDRSNWWNSWGRKATQRLRPTPVAEHNLRSAPKQRILLLDYHRSGRMMNRDEDTVEGNGGAQSSCQGRPVVIGRERASFLRRGARHRKDGQMATVTIMTTSATDCRVERTQRAVQDPGGKRKQSERLLRRVDERWNDTLTLALNLPGTLPRKDATNKRRTTQLLCEQIPRPLRR
uniref:Uncharacterized protein n=1 Tax=Plectus sambesii TaxID=2011161 RepID=A0A914VBM4_9BILA